MKRDAAELAELSRLIDAALELPAEERSTWIEQLPAAHDTLKPALRKLLAMPPAGNNTYTLSDVSQQVQAAMQGAAGAAETLEFKEGARVGPYELIRELGRGGMGTVWLARRTEGLTRRTVALKLPHPGMLHAEFAARMGRERDILESLAHPNIARLYDAGVTPAGQPYLALEYIEGVPINVYCDQKRLGLRERLRLFAQVLRAIQHAHSHLVIHRDLKPANILVTGTGVAMVLDFGIAKLTVEGATAETALTQFGGRALTPDFASPEQIAGQPLTTASDVYSLGVILYELFTGERPYKLTRGSAAALEEAILASDVRRPSQAVGDGAKAELRSTSANRLARELRGDLDTIVLTAMRVELAERYRTVDAFALDIEQYLDNRAIHARPESWWEASRRFVVRHKLAVGAAAAVVMALGTGLAVALWQRGIAQTESANQKASRDFVVGLFDSVAENGAVGLSPAETTAKQMLDIGTRQLFEEHGTDSQVRLDLLLLLGSLNNSLDELDTALKAMDEAIAVAARLYGEDDLRYANAMTSKAHVLARKGDFTQAMQVAGRALEVIGKPDAESSEMFAKLHILLGNLHNQIDPPESPVPRDHLELALKTLKAIDSRSDDLPRANYYLARTWESAAQFARAEPYYQAGIEAADANFGAQSYVAAFGRDNLGDMLRHVHRYEEAEQLLRGALATFQKLYGPRHVNVAMTTMNLAMVLAADGRRVEAEKTATAAIDSAVASRGEDDQVVARFRLHTARMKFAMGKFEEARVMHVTTLGGKLAQDPSNRRQMMFTGVELAQALITLNRLDEAAPYLVQAESGIANTPDATSVRAVKVDVRQAELHTARGDTAAAARYYTRAIDRVLGLGDSGSAAIPDTLFAYTQQLPSPEAARATIARIETVPMVKTLRTGGRLSADEAVQLRTALGRLEQASGNFAAARKDLDEALKLRMTHDEATSPWLAQVQGMIAECHAQAGDLPAARSALAQAQLTLDKGNTKLPYFTKPLTELRARLAKS